MQQYDSSFQKKHPSRESIDRLKSEKKKLCTYIFISTNTHLYGHQYTDQRIGIRCKG